MSIIIENVEILNSKLQELDEKTIKIIQDYFFESKNFIKLL